MIGFSILASFVAVIVLAFATIIQKKLPDAVMLFMGVGLGSVILFFLFQAPDVALTEAVIGAAISSVIFLITLKQIKEN